MWLKVIGAMVALVGIVLIYDARRLIKKYFKDTDENMTVLGMKIFGALLAIIGGILNII